MTEATLYKARAGSVAERVIVFLEQNGPASTSMLVDAIEDINRNGVAANVATAVKYGALYVEKRRGEAWYSVKPFGVAGAATFTPGDDEDAAAPPAPPTGVFPGAAKLCADCGMVASHHADGCMYAPKKAAAPEPAAVAIEKAPSTHFRAGLWTDGALTIEKGPNRCTLSKEDTAELALLLGVPA